MGSNVECLVNRANSTDQRRQNAGRPIAYLATTIFELSRRFSVDL